MPLTTINRRYPRNPSFNVTPIIDIVFLLIIFFLIVCQFIEAENFPVTVPDNCEFAKTNNTPGIMLTTLTIMKTTENDVSFAVGSEKIIATNNNDLTKQLTKLINIQLQKLPPAQRMVELRIDKDIPFAHAQYALAAVAKSSASNIRIATLKGKM